MPAPRWLLRLTVVAGVLLTAAGGADAQQEDDGAAPKAAPKAAISADEISYDNSRAMVIATGNVQIAHGERILLADLVQYDQSGDTVTATGNVVLLEPGGEVMFADHVELTDQLRSGIIENVRILMANDVRFAANGARRIDGRKTVMTRAVYSPCKVCEDKPDKPPLWQIKASTIVHDQETRDVVYTNARLEFFGFPIVYTPYLIHPDPTVERRTGLLVPLFGTSSVFGGFVRIPMFMVFGDSIDATIEPIVSVQERPVLGLEYRQRLNKGLIELSGSVTKADRETIAFPFVIQDDTRGHIFAKGQFDVSERWRWGFDYQRASDRTYLNRYEFFGDPGDILESKLFLEGLNRRTYSAANIFGYQETSLADPGDEPLVVPILDHKYVGEADSLGGRWTFGGNFRSHVLDGGNNTQRLSAQGGYRVPFITDFGLITTLSGSVEADGYRFDQIFSGASNVSVGRVVPRLAAEWRYPLVRGTGGIRQIIEPQVAIIAAPNTGNPVAEADREDTVAVDLDDTNLFSEDQIPGRDRADLGQRAVWGLKAGLYGEKGGRVTAFVGQSYRVRNDGNAGETGDLRSGASDYVGRLEVAPNKYLDLLYRFRLADKNLTNIRSELGVAMGPAAFKAESDYIFIASEASGGLFTEDREEINANLTSQITDEWSMRLHSRRDLAQKGGTLEHGGNLTYEDECFRVQFEYNRNFKSSVDIEKTTTFTVQLVFKSIGDISAKQKQIN